MKCNTLMNALFIKDKSENTVDDLMRTERRAEKLADDLKYENGCLFLANHNGKANSENVADRVEFEAFHNEILINSEFSKKKITPAFALQFFAQFNALLMAFRENEESAFDEKICAVMSEDEGRWTYRFHIAREGEPLWISEDTEKFDQPVMYDVF